MKPSSVFDVLADFPEAQARYRDSSPFREFIDALDVCLRTAEENLSSDDYAMFVQELQRMAKNEIVKRGIELP